MFAPVVKLGIAMLWMWGPGWPRVRDRPGEPAGDGDLQRGESGRPATVASQDVHRLAGVREGRSLALVRQQVMAFSTICIQRAPGECAGTPGLLSPHGRNAR
jgi:hypothetical protein